jgi:hypothetical protein
MTQTIWKQTEVVKPQTLSTCLYYSLVTLVLAVYTSTCRDFFHYLEWLEPGYWIQNLIPLSIIALFHFHI